MLDTEHDTYDDELALTIGCLRYGFQSRRAFQPFSSVPYATLKLELALANGAFW